MRTRLWWAPALLLAAGCELSEITVALPQDIVVAEVLLRAESPVQTAYLHRTLGQNGSARVFSATVHVHDVERGADIVFSADADSLCLTPAPPPGLQGVGTCYVARGDADMIRPGARYTLRIALPDGPELRAATVVPGAFALTQPVASPCALEPGSTLELMWTASTGAWVYVTEVRFTGLTTALRAGGVALPPETPEPIELLGLAIGAADTTMAFPAGFGLFDRAEESLHPVLVAIRGGLPADVRADIVVAAADRNWVNWIRGGSFNPSGAVRVPSVSGGGTGVFGAVVTRDLTMQTEATELPACR
jgi:hypothetical protein